MEKCMCFHLCENSIEIKILFKAFKIDLYNLKNQLNEIPIILSLNKSVKLACLLFL